MSAPSWPPAQWPPDPGARRDVRGPARLLVFLLVLGAVPAVALFLAHRAAASRAEQGEPAAPTAPAPVPHVVTPLVSLRREPTTIATTMANEALVASLAPIGERVAPGSCLVVGVDGAPVYDDAGRDQRDPRLQHEARHRRRRPRGPRTGPPLHDGGQGRSGAGRRHHRREPLPRRRRRPGAGHEPVRGRGRRAGDASAAVRHAAGDAGRPDRRRRGHPHHRVGDR